MERTVDVGDIFESLADPYRRQITLGLLDSAPRSETEMAELVAERVPDVGPETDAIRLALRHAHLPRLHELAFIEWNRETGEVARGPHWDEFEPVLHFLREQYMVPSDSAT